MTNEEDRNQDNSDDAGKSPSDDKVKKAIDTYFRHEKIDLLNVPLTELSTLGPASLQTIQAPLTHPDDEVVGRARELTETIAFLRGEVQDKALKLKTPEMGEGEKAAAIARLELAIAQLTEKERLSFLLARVNEDAQAMLLRSERFRKRFLDLSVCEAYVMSVDIRRSTELMLKARSPELFAQFITTLCKDLEEVIKAHYGVFDKFTGDGVMAFFPVFFSGEDAPYHVVATADECHRIFQARYREFRSSFTSVLNDVGLGIGIDYGPSHLVQMAGGLTVVGAPVVYACRMAGGPGGKTLLNQPAYEKISTRLSGFCFLVETEVTIKNEGATLAYEVRLNKKEYLPMVPDWGSTESSL